MNRSPLVRDAIILVALFFFMASVGCSQEVRGRWLNPLGCQDSDFVLFDFDQKIGIQQGGSRYKLEFSSNRLVLLNGADSVVTEFSDISREEDVLKLSSLNGQQIRLISFDVMNSDRKIELGEIEGGVFEVLNHAGDSQEASRKFIQFLPEHMFLETRISNDTVTAENRWFLFSSDSLNWINLRSATCAKLFIVRDDRENYQMVVGSKQGYKIHHLRRIALRPFANERRIEGTWETHFSTGPTVEDIKAVEFTTDTIAFIRPTLSSEPDRAQGRFWLDYFGKFLFTDIPPPFNRIPVTIESNRMVLTIGIEELVLGRAR